jgi:predicted lipid-binding transport protein (Tim44 family)
MDRLLVGAAGMLFGSGLFAASNTPIAAGGGWLPTLGTFALGGLLGAFFGNSGFTAAFILTVVAVVAMVAVRAFAKRKDESVAPPPVLAGLGAQIAAAAPPSKEGEFDADSFLHGAKLSFVKLKLAGELGRLDRIRDLTTAEIYDQLQASKGGRLGKADLVSLNAELVKMVTQGDRNVASVRFSGMVREAPGAAPVGFEEFWSLSKPLDSASGWLLAGIQQVH